MRSISEIQERLKELDIYDGEIDGNKASSEYAVKAFQRMNGLEPDGIAGKLTQAILFPEETGNSTDADYLYRVITTVLPRCNKNLVSNLLPWMVSELNRIGVLRNKKRLAQFLGQTSIECDYYKTLREYGDINYFERVYGRGRAKGERKSIIPQNPSNRRDLDYWFIGRGILQVTHNYNYDTVSNKLDKDFVTQPWTLQEPEWAVKASIVFWTENNLVRFAESNDDVGLTKAINGGTNHLAERIDYTNRFRKVV